MEFYVPLSQPRTAGSSAQEMPPASSTAAVTATATATVSANDQRAQRAEARQRAEKAPSNNIDTSFPQMEAEDTGPSDEPMPSAEGVEGVHDDEGTSGTVQPFDPHFAILCVQVLGSKSTTLFLVPTLMTMSTVFPQLRSYSFQAGRPLIGPLVLKVRFLRLPFFC